MRCIWSGYSRMSSANFLAADRLLDLSCSGMSRRTRWSDSGLHPVSPAMYDVNFFLQTLSRGMHDILYIIFRPTITTTILIVKIPFCVSFRSLVWVFIQWSKYSSDSHRRKTDLKRLCDVKVSMPLSGVAFTPYPDTASCNRPDLHVGPQFRPTRKGHYHRNIVSSPSPKCWILVRYTQRCRIPLNWSLKWQPMWVEQGTLHCP